MVICNECIKNVLSRIYLKEVAYRGEPPQIYWDAIQALEKLDTTRLTVNSNSDPNCPLGWRRGNYPLLVVGKKNDRLKFSYTKKQLNNGDTLIIVEEVADTYGNILTENNLEKSNTMKTKKNVIRLTESDLHSLIEEAVREVLKESNNPMKRTVKAKYGEGYIVVDVDLEECEVHWAFIVNREVANYGTMDIEGYLDNSWFPYEETHHPAKWMPKSFEPIIYRLFKKLGMRDNEE